MKKTLIVLLSTLLLLIVAAVLYVWLANPANRLVKAAIEKYGSEITQARVGVRDVDLSLADGKGVLYGLTLGNPKGFKSPHAFKADTIELVLDPASLAGDIVLIRKIHVDAPSIAYEDNGGTANFDVIERNAQAFASASKSKAAHGGGTRMIIETLAIRNASVNYNGLMDLRLPDIELRNIGKRQGGASAAEVASAVIAELNRKLAIELAKVAAAGAVGGAAIGVGMAISRFLAK